MDGRPESGPRGGAPPPRYAVTLLGPRVEDGHAARAADELARLGLRVEGVERLSSGGAVPAAAADAHTAAVEIAVRGGAAEDPRRRPDAGGLRRALRGVLPEAEGVDVVVQRAGRRRRDRRLVCLDMDSTLVDAEVIDELARAAGAGEEVAALTAAAMRGEIDFPTAFRARIGRLAGLRAEVFEEVARGLRLTPGAARLVTALGRSGRRVAVVSGGFAWAVRRVGERFGLCFDHVLAHELVLREGRLTGGIEGEVIDGRAKAAFVRAAAAREGLARGQVAAAGDGANDLEMLRAAGLGVAFRAHPALRERAQHVLDHAGLDGILYLLGMRDREIDGT